jgi:hypothetical protein
MFFDRFFKSFLYQSLKELRAILKTLQAELGLSEPRFAGLTNCHDLKKYAICL